MAQDRVSDKKGPAEHVAELKDLVVGYARQETWDPLKTLGRYVGFGVGGGVAIGLGCVFLLLGLLRGLQSWDALDGTGAMSLIPFAATVLAAAVMIGLAVFGITKDDTKKKETTS
ncbi:MAG TPA: phage holin family protein [Microthrixaceae bacterium]|jgi:hypothetical protein|nr:phage holin family protein [Microthrixaceae bacterium]HQF95615.1 phage holin family protein [Microthrixaceae bacterium]